MKRYKQLFKEEDSLSQLTDATIPQKIVDFIKENPFPQDDSGVHKLAEKLNIEPDILEQYIYAFLTLILVGGKSKGQEIKASQENLDIGYKIEIEHCEYETDNKVIKAMQDILVKKISFDHLAETNTYYVDGVNFQNELEQEQK